MIKLNKIGNDICSFVKTNAGTILSIAGTVGVVGTAILSSRSAIKAIDIWCDPDETNHKRKIVKAYLPTVLVGAATIGCILGSNKVNHIAYSQLAGLFLLSDLKSSEYRDKVKEICGEEVHNQIMDSIVKETAKPVHLYSTGVCSNDSLDILTMEPEIVRTFYDSYSKRYFESTLSQVIQAEYHLNRNFALGAGISLNDFYEFLGLTPVDGGEKIGWDVCTCAEFWDMYWIDFNHHVSTLDDGMEVVVIDYVFDPVLFDADLNDI